MVITIKHLEEIRELLKGQRKTDLPVELINGTFILNEPLQINATRDLNFYCDKRAFYYEIQPLNSQLLIIFFTL